MSTPSKEKGQRIPESARISELNCIDLSNPDTQSTVSLLKKATLSPFLFTCSDSSYAA